MELQIVAVHILESKHRRIKAIAAIRGETMRALVGRAIDKLIAEHDGLTVVAGVPDARGANGKALKARAAHAEVKA